MSAMTSQEQLDHANRESAHAWDDSRQRPLLKLRAAEALLARYDAETDQRSVHLAERRQWLKDRCAALVRDADPAEVLHDYHVRRMVLRLWSDRGLRKLEARAKAAKAGATDGTPGGITPKGTASAAPIES